MYGGLGAAWTATVSWATWRSVMETNRVKPNTNEIITRVRVRDAQHTSHTPLWRPALLFPSLICVTVSRHRRIYQKTWDTQLSETGLPIVRPETSNPLQKQHHSGLLQNRKAADSEENGVSPSSRAKSSLKTSSPSELIFVRTSCRISYGDAVGNEARTLAQLFSVVSSISKFEANKRP